MSRLKQVHRRLGYLNDVLMIPMFTEIILDTGMAFHSQEAIELFAITNLFFCLLFFLSLIHI